MQRIKFVRMPTNNIGGVIKIAPDPCGLPTTVGARARWDCPCARWKDAACTGAVLAGGVRARKEVAVTSAQCGFSLWNAVTTV